MKRAGQDTIVALLPVALLATGLYLAGQDSPQPLGQPAPQQKQAPAKQKSQPQLADPANTRTAPDPSGRQWIVSYFHDHVSETLEFSDIAFPSVDRGIAVGTVVDEAEGRIRKSVALLTGDGGTKWDRVELEDIPVSLYFLNDSVGWMVSAQGIWKTEESGRSWKRISKHKSFSIARVWFLDPEHGFAVGTEKTVLETKNGGKTWNPVAAAATPAGQKNISVYDNIWFADQKHGIITGSAVPPRPQSQRGTVRQVPTMTLELETHDGGVNWKASSAPLLGQVADLKLAGSNGLALFAFNYTFEVPSEVYHLNLTTGKSNSVFRQENRRVTGMALFADGTAFLAATQTRGAQQTTIIPGPVKMFSSTDLKNWVETEVDYRAVSGRTVLAGADANHMWAATDTGMLLQLTQAAK